MRTLRYAVVAVVVMVTIFCAYALYQGHKNESGVSAEISESMVARSILSYAVDPVFSSGNLLGDLTGTKAKLEMYVLDEGKVYFSLPHSEDWKMARDQLTKRPKEIEFSASGQSPYRLGSLVLRKEHVYFFRIDSDNFKIDPSAQVSIPFQQANYEPTARELAGFLTHEVLMCGREYFVAQQTSGHTIYSSNFGARVIVPHEPSLTRFVKTIIIGEKDHGRAVQKLLDFVTNEIEYDDNEREWAGTRQVIKLANEVLMTRKATCASKAALYASLLEQIDIDYVLVYYPKHLTVFVSGQYSDTNNHTILLDGKSYYLAETTVPGFVIGQTVLENFSPENDWTHIQRPRERSVPQRK